MINIYVECYNFSFVSNSFIDFFQEKDAKEQGVSSALKVDTNPQGSKQVSLHFFCIYFSLIEKYFNEKSWMLFSSIYSAKVPMSKFNFPRTMFKTRRICHC